MQYTDKWGVCEKAEELNFEASKSNAMHWSKTALCAAALLSACTSEQLRETSDGVEPSVPQFETTAVCGGRIRLKFREGEEPAAVAETRSGIRTGLAKFDRAAAGLGVTRMQRVFPPAGRFEERTRREGLHRWYDVWFDSVTPVTRAAGDFSQLPGVERVEPVYTTRPIGFSGTAVPAAPPASRAAAAPFDDPGLALQWHYDNDGTLTDAVAGADINLFRAWEVTSGTPEVIVAVVDGGIDFRHEDLSGNVGNRAELYGQEGVDDDGNGYVDDIYGWNFIYSSAYPYGSNKITPVEHGTHVAGTIGAENNNGKGVCGVAGGRGGHTGVRLISCQMFTENKSDNGDEVAALKYGADAGAVISQNSWGYTNVYSMPEVAKDAIEYFIKYAGTDENGEQVGPMKGGIVIFAAGNEERDYMSYPACYEKVVAVSALAPDYKKSWYSNFSSWIDVAAPGGTYRTNGRYSDECAVYSTLPGDKYGYMQGTSMACPHVSGIAALAVAKYGGPGFTPDKLRTYLERGVHEVDSYNPEYKGRLGVGLIDAYLAVSMDRGIDPDPVTDLRHSDTAGEVELTWTVPEDGDDGRANSFILMWRVGTLENPDPDNLPEGTFTATVPVRDKQAGETISYILTDIAERTRYVVAVIAVDPWGNRSPTSVISFGTPANTPPTLVREGDTAVSIPYNETRTVAFLVSDPDSHGFTYELQDPSGAVTPRKDDERLYLDIRNYKRVPGSYTARITVSDSFGASDAASFDFTLQPNLPPVPNNAFAPVYLGSMQETAEFTPAAGFDDEIPETVTYALEYDTDALYLQATAGGGYRIMPLRYGRSEVTVTATDEEGLAARNSFAVLCRDDSREADLYPNPVESLLTIRMGRSVQGELGVTLYDAAGRTVLRRTVGIAPTEPAEIDLSALGSGAYTIRLEHAGGSLTRTIVKL